MLFIAQTIAGIVLFLHISYIAQHTSLQGLSALRFSRIYGSKFQFQFI